MEKIDSPLDAALNANADRPTNSIVDSIIVAVGTALPLTAPFVAVAEHFGNDQRFKRIMNLFNTFRDEYEALQQQCSGNAEKLRELNERIESPDFKRALIQSAEESIRASDSRKVTQFVAVLARRVDPFHEWGIDADPATLIRDVAQIDDGDIRVLQLLCDAFQAEIKYAPNLNDPNIFSAKAQVVLKMSDELSIHRDDFYSYCKRLEGFGLAIEAIRNTSVQAPGDYCFRPTLRGARLSEIIRQRKSTG